MKLFVKAHRGHAARHATSLQSIQTFTINRPYLGSDAHRRKLHVFVNARAMEQLHIFAKIVCVISHYVKNLCCTIQRVNATQVRINSCCHIALVHLNFTVSYRVAEIQ